MPKEHKSDIFERLYAIGMRLNSSLKPEEVLYSILECGVEELGGDLGWISLVENERYLVTVTSYGFDKSILPERISFDEGITGMVAQTGVIYYSRDVSKEKRFIKVDDSIKSEVAVPLIGFNKVVGVFNIESSKEDAFDEEHLKLASALAEQAVIAVENAKKYSEIDTRLKASMVGLEEKVQALKALSEVTSVINSSLDLDEVLANIIEKVKDITEGAECQLLIRDDETGKLIIHTPFELVDGLSEGSEVDENKGITGWVVKNRAVLNIPDVSRDNRYRRWIPDTKSEIAIPLMKSSDCIGVLNIESRKKNAFSKDMVEILKMLAANAVSAICNAELFKKYRETRQRLEFSNYMASMGEFTADLIHWFGNKAGLILGCTENIIAETGTNESVLEDIDIIKRSMSEVLKMKKRILGGTDDETMQRISLKPVIEGSVAEFKEQDVIRIDGIDKDIFCMAKALSLKHVFRAVLENSVDAVSGLEKGEVAISVFDGNGRIMITIKDNGPGFPKENLTKLFQPFFSTKKAKQGTGMGLWLSYRALKSMNGDISVEGDSGKGLTFTICLEK